MKKLFFISAILLAMLSGCENYSSGSRVGYITKLSQKGNLCKTWEGELTITNSGVGVSTFEFSIDKDENDTVLIKSIQKSMDNGDKVKLLYHQTKFKNWWNNRGETNYFVIDNFILAPGPNQNNQDSDTAKSVFTDPIDSAITTIKYIDDSK